MEIVVEVNVTERKSHRPIVEIPFGFPFRDAQVRASISAYDNHEMLGTKMRALFQRRRGRDLFDLYRALTVAKPPVDPSAVIESFLHYLRQEAGAVRRLEFVAILESHLADAGFRSDTDDLLRKGIAYDPGMAGEYIRSHLLDLLPV